MLSSVNPIMWVCSRMTTIHSMEYYNYRLCRASYRWYSESQIISSWTRAQTSYHDVHFMLTAWLSLDQTLLLGLVHVWTRQPLLQAGSQGDGFEGRRRKEVSVKKAMVTAVIIRSAVTQLHALDGLNCAESWCATQGSWVTFHWGQIAEGK